MFSVIFEVLPNKENWDDYFDNAKMLRPVAPDVLGKGPEDKPWGMYEFGVSDPDQTLVRVGRPSNRNHLG